MQENEKPTIKLSELTDMYDIEDDTKPDDKSSELKQETDALEIRIEQEEKKLKHEWETEDW